MCDYLRERNVARVGAWAGSMGASMILLCGQTEPLDHLCMMIPVLDWRKSVLDNMLLRSVRSRIVSAGFDTGELASAYRLISPAYLPLPLAPERTQKFFGRYDQLNDSAIALDFAKRNGVTDIIGYPRSHSTQLFDGKMIRDYGRFLDSLQKK